MDNKFINLVNFLSSFYGFFCILWFAHSDRNWFRNCESILDPLNLKWEISYFHVDDIFKSSSHAVKGDIVSSSVLNCCSDFVLLYQSHSAWVLLDTGWKKLTATRITMEPMLINRINTTIGKKTNFKTSFSCNPEAMHAHSCYHWRRWEKIPQSGMKANNNRTQKSKSKGKSPILD